MRPINFRGKRVADGEFVYGGFTHVHPEFYVGGRQVKPDSVAQLVGYDMDGNEVYEGDILVDELEQEYTAEIYDRPEKIHALKLKEAQP